MICELFKLLKTTIPKRIKNINSLTKCFNNNTLGAYTDNSVFVQEYDQIIMLENFEEFYISF